MIYEEDHFHPETDDVSMNNNDALYNIKKMDKGYHKINRKLGKTWIDGKYYKNISIECYVSGDTGNKIRNAVTGFRTGSKVGSIEEDLYFKVKLVNGDIKKGSGNFFYDSPEQYEKHHFCILHQNIKEQWYKKQIQTKLQLKV